MEQPNNNDKNRKFYDEAFTEIFGNRKIIQSLLEDFIGESWVKLIDFESMKIEKSVFKSINRRRKESDLLLYFKLRDPSPLKEFSIFILLEFQRKPGDMCLRFLEYLHRIYRRYGTKEKSGKIQLFPVIPIVIYNGSARWKENPDFLSHFILPSESIKQYIPAFRYILFDLVLMDDKWLKEMKSSVSYFFRLDKTDFSNRSRAENRIIELLKDIKVRDPAIYKMMKNYVIGLLSYKGVDYEEVNDYIDNIEERGDGMLAESLDALIEKEKRLGRKKGREEGREEGLEQGIGIGAEKKGDEIVCKMLEEGFDYSMIQHLTGMTLERIMVLEEGLKN